MDKERATRDIVVRVKPSLYDKFRQKCEANYKTVSEVIRELMVSYAKPQENKVIDAVASIKPSGGVQATPGKVIDATATLHPIGGFFKVKT